MSSPSARTSSQTEPKNMESWLSDSVYEYLSAHKATLNPTDFFTTARQTTLVAEFKRWKIDKAQYFWAEVMRSKTTVLSLTRTETSLIQYAAPLASNTIKESSRSAAEKRSGHTGQSNLEQHRCSSDYVDSEAMHNSEDGEIEAEAEVDSGSAGGIIAIGDQSKSSAACELDVDTAADDLDSPPEMQVVVPSRAKATPFYDLIAYVFLKAKKKSATLPSPSSSALCGLSVNYQEMYKAALAYLRQPGPIEAKKDVLVLLSGIINTVSPNARRFSLSKKIMTESRLPELDPQSETHKIVKGLLAELLKALYPDLDKDRHCEPDFIQLQKKVWRLLQDAASSRHTHAETATYTTLQIVQQVLLWIELGLFTPLTSEHVYVSAWAMLFNILLFGTTVRAIPGEFVSKAITSARQLVEDEFGSTTSTSCGRNVDSIIKIQVDNEWKTEIAIFEFKASTSTRQMCEKQQKKSVRLNAAILLDLEKRGLDLQHSYPIIAEGRGLSLDFYTLRRYDDILGAGRSTAKGISLPPQVSQLKTFLQSNSILTLLSFREHLRRYAVDVVDVMAMSPSTPFGGGDDDDPSSTPDDPPSTPADPPARQCTPPPRKRPWPFMQFSRSKRDKVHAHTDDDDDDDDGRL
ncbi:hypothetical protein EC957_011223 [Mortierella hygrophila]|uniref:Uncharacterized protein n=1 Tax=Mortierella hygrophila TaxID=979708 RepID=A0A9P6K406_9FUNG|nr:hypothetical protein EC957_011223 [Mortierella hygrophila]